METTNNTFDITKLENGTLIVVNDNRFTTGDNPKQGTFRRFSADFAKMQLTIGGKLVWLESANFISLGSAWPGKRTEQTEAAVTSPTIAPEALEVSVAPVAETAAEPVAAEAAAEETDAPAPVKAPVYLPAPQEAIVTFLQKNRNAAAAGDIAAGVGRAEAGIKGSLNNLFKNKYLDFAAGFYTLTEKAVNYVPAPVVEKPAKPAKVKAEKPAKVAQPLSAARERSQKMFELWDAGKTDKEVAEAVGTDLSTARNIKITYLKNRFEKTGEKVLFTGKPGTKIYQIVELYDQGKTPAEARKLIQADASYFSFTTYFTLDPEKAVKND